MSILFPNRTETVIKLDKLFMADEKVKRLVSERLSSRMVKCASVLKKGEFLGWQIAVPRKGLVNMAVFGTADVGRSDLEWISEKTGKTTKHSLCGPDGKNLTELYELYKTKEKEKETNRWNNYGIEIQPELKNKIEQFNPCQK